MSNAEQILAYGSLLAAVWTIVGLLVRHFARGAYEISPLSVVAVNGLFALAPIAWLCGFAGLIAYAWWDLGGFPSLMVEPLGPPSLGWTTFRKEAGDFLFGHLLLLGLLPLALTPPIHAALARTVWRRERGGERAWTPVYLGGVGAIVLLLVLNPLDLTAWLFG